MSANGGFGEGDAFAGQDARVLAWLDASRIGESEAEASAGDWLRNIGTGAASGAATGAVAGPWGALIGGLVGAGLGAAQTGLQGDRPPPAPQRPAPTPRPATAASAPP